MPIKLYTVLTILGSAPLILLADYFLNRDGGDDATISRVCLLLGRAQWLFVVAIVGLFSVLESHLFWPKPLNDPETFWEELIYVAIIVGGLFSIVVADLVGMLTGWTPRSMHCSRSIGEYCIAHPFVLFQVTSVVFWWAGHRFIGQHI